MIREAKPEDIDAILELGLECHEQAFTEYPVDIPESRRTISQFVLSPGKFAMVKEVDGEVLGVLLGFISPVWFSKAKESSDLLFYVRNDPRSVGAGTLLLKRFIRWSQDKGASGMALAVSFGGPKSQDTGKIYRKQGFSQVGGLHVIQFNQQEKSP